LDGLKPISVVCFVLECITLLHHLQTHMIFLLNQYYYNYLFIDILDDCTIRIKRKFLFLMKCRKQKLAVNIWGCAIWLVPDCRLIHLRIFFTNYTWYYSSSRIRTIRTCWRVCTNYWWQGVHRWRICSHSKKETSWMWINIRRYRFQSWY